MGHIFMSYSRHDTAVVDRIVGTLQEAGHKVWLDRHDIPGGKPWRREIVREIEEADAFLIALSSSSVTSENVRKELDLAETAQKRVIPLEIMSVDVPAEMRYQLIGLQRIDLATDFDVGCAKLLQALGREDKVEFPDDNIAPSNRTKKYRKSIPYSPASLVTVLLIIISLSAIAWFFIPKNPVSEKRPDQFIDLIEQIEQGGTREDRDKAISSLIFEWGNYSGLIPTLIDKTRGNIQNPSKKHQLISSLAIINNLEVDMLRKHRDILIPWLRRIMKETGPQARKKAKRIQQKLHSEL